MTTKPVSIIFLVKDPPLDRLAALVEFMRAVADQFIFVVDDRTSQGDVDIILSWPNAEVIMFKWCDDFSAARNAALPHVRNPWTLHLDPDELPSIAAMNYIAEVTSPDSTDESIAHVFWFFNWWGGVLGEVQQYHYHIRLWRTGHGQFYRAVHELVMLDGLYEGSTRGNIAKMVHPSIYFIHSKPLDRLETDQAYYETLGERSL